MTKLDTYLCVCAFLLEYRVFKVKEYIYKLFGIYFGMPQYMPWRKKEVNPYFSVKNRCTLANYLQV